MKYNLKKVIAKNSDSKIILAEYSINCHTYDVLIKTVLPPISDELIERLIGIKQIDHCGVIRLVDYGECADSGVKKYYMTTLHIAGITLTQILQKLSVCKVKPPDFLVYHIINSVCGILEYNHNFKFGKKSFIAHGNICPDNILISSDGDVYLTDTGLADLVKYRFNGIDLIKNELTVFNHPEVHDGKEYQKHHEIYSAGMTFLSMFAGYDNFNYYSDRLKSHENSSLSDIFPFIDSQTLKIIDCMRDQNVSGAFSSIGQLKEWISSKSESGTDIKNYSRIAIKALFHDAFKNDSLIEESLTCCCDDTLSNFLRKIGFTKWGDELFKDNCNIDEPETLPKVKTDQSEDLYDAVLVQQPMMICEVSSRRAALDAFTGIRAGSLVINKTENDNPFASIIKKK